MFVMYVRANSSILISVFTVTCRTNLVKVPGVIFRLCPLAWPTGLQGQVNPLASSENHCSKDSFWARRHRLPFEPFLSRLTELRSPPPHLDRRSGRIRRRFSQEGHGFEETNTSLDKRSR